jgi:serpin B
MKKIIIGLTFLSLLLTASCNVIDNVISPEPSTDTPNGAGGYVKSNLERETSPEVEPSQVQSLVEGNTAFATAFYDQIRQQSGNIIFSPISLSLALSMTMAGAETTTEDAMLAALRITLPEEEVYPAFNALLLAIEESENAAPEESEGSKFQLNIANSIWGQAGYDFKAPFLDTLARYFGAGVYNVDYIQDPEAARLAINDWVEEETEDKIQDLIPPGAINDLTRLVLANAIYFNGSWLYPFSQNGTTEEPFYLLDGSEITVEMMKLFGERLSYGEGEGYQAVSLPYLSQDFAMTFLVPDSGEFAGFEESLNAEKLAGILNAMSAVQVDLRMPKFDFETATDAKDPLKAIGMSEAFDPDRADFSGMTEAEKLLITDVLHKATITVDEKGTEAAAATAVIVGETSAMPGEPISLIIDRPFLFVIRHEPTGTILFMGRATQP